MSLCVQLVGIATHRETQTWQFGCISLEGYTLIKKNCPIPHPPTQYPKLFSVIILLMKIWCFNCCHSETFVCILWDKPNE